MRIAQITDLHVGGAEVAAHYKPGSWRTHTVQSGSFAGPFGFH
ncbi:MAG: hypothetical protein ABI790_18075 [Betaproteobacteria bacterium]